MRENVIRFAWRHPLTIEQIRRLGDFPTYAAASVWARKMQKQGRLHLVGTMPNRGTRPLDVFCNGWAPKRDNLRHESIGSEVAMLFPDAGFTRGYNVNIIYKPDLEMHIGGLTYFMEIDCGTMSKAKVIRRWRKYAKCDDTVLVVTASNITKAIDAEERLAELVRWSADFEVYFTTLDRLTTAAPKLFDEEGRIWTSVDGQLHKLATPLQTNSQTGAEEPEESPEVSSEIGSYEAA